MGTPVAMATVFGGIAVSLVFGTLTLVVATRMARLPAAT
jgi:hypothetical protein